MINDYVLQNIRLVNHYDSVLERSAYLPNTEDDNSQRNNQRNNGNRRNNRVAANTEHGEPLKDSSYQPTSRLQKTYYSL